MGLDVLIDYLSFRLGMMRHEQRIADTLTESEERLNPQPGLNSTTTSEKQNGYIRPPLDMSHSSPSMKRRSKHVAKLNMGESKNDIHVCIMCMRAIMNNKVACMQFVNIVVHSVEDMNFRVHLQYEFTALGLDVYLESLRHTESEELQVQISAYLDNVFDVAALMEDSETKTAALEKVAELEDELGQVHDRLQEIELEALAKVAELETMLAQTRAERDEIYEASRLVTEEVTTLRRAVQHHEEESKNRQSMLESKIIELESITKSLPKGASIVGLADLLMNTNSLSTPHLSSDPSLPPPLTTPTVIPPPPPPAPTLPPPPPCPPPPPNKPNTPLPPPAPGLMPAPDGAMTIKRKVQTKYKLPTVNWIALKPNQVRGTIFNELDDDRLHGCIDFNDFEERFKIGIAGPLTNGSNTVTDGLSTFPSKRFKKPENVSLLEHTRLRNIAISRRKLDMPIEKVINAITTLDLKQLPLENVELLQRMVPTDLETKSYREYIIEKKNVNLLTEEDKFLLQLTKVERLSVKLSVMNYIGNFFDNLHLVTPQIHAIISASSSVKNSKRLKSVLEVILAFGNYLNSSKRGPAYGFKLQSLDTLLDTKSTDKKMCLLHYIVATIRQKFPELVNFDSDLLYIEKAAVVSLENIITDVQELEKGMDAVRKEADIRGKGNQSLVLRDFLANAEDKLKKLKSDVKTAQDTFRECVEYFAESPRTTDANSFFSLLVRFTKAFKVADQENEQRRRLELAAMNANNKTNEDVLKKNKLNQKKQQDAVINELKHKTKMVHEKKLLQQDEVYNGALEDILLGLKSEPYRRADAVRRSQRRRIDNNRLSKTMEELEF
ncbi:formin-like protein [Holotrichia oblita]|uniref:Formin-like protein n=1 Tax=Holotrichia oblita TaxID=644536 RepID=A0ACB9T4T8_HOLOL|nr:formin-like protein [Holotrichia oblita]